MTMGILKFFTSKKDTSNTQIATAGARGLRTETHTIGTHSRTMDLDSYHSSDEKEWLRYLGQPLRTYRKPGLSMKEEYDLWHAARIRSRALAAAK
jgi:hypothetical protein